MEDVKEEATYINNSDRAFHFVLSIVYAYKYFIVLVTITLVMQLWNTNESQPVLVHT